MIYNTIYRDVARSQGRCPSYHASSGLQLNEMTLDSNILLRLVAECGLTDASIVVAPVATGAASVTLQPERPLYPASMIKVPIAMALAQRCVMGDLRLEDTVAVDGTNATANDAPSPFVAGYKATLGDYLHAMVARSDNVATNVLIDVLGRDTIGPACAAFGLRDTAVRRKLSGSLPLIADPGAIGRNSHPAADAARLFAVIAARADLDRDPVYAALAGQIWNDKLSRGLMPGDRFAHKTGDTDDVSHDGGVLTLADGRRFILVAYTTLPANPETDARFGAFSSALRPYLDR
jgi:beta-lactamase class A